MGISLPPFNPLQQPTYITHAGCPKKRGHIGSRSMRGLTLQLTPCTLQTIQTSNC